MSLDAPFTGQLYLPDKALTTGTSPVLDAHGHAIAHVQWHFWTVRSRFEILDSRGTVLAEGGTQGWTGRQLTVRTPAGRTVVDIRFGLWRPINGATITLGSGRSLGVRQTSIWSDRNFEFSAGGRVVGRITPTTGVLSFRPDSYSFVLNSSAMTALEAISLAQALRAAVRAMRQQHSG
ncbi:hypothetical protein Cs7R123_67240 [Catellatospora sp. TT07R-123]|uniref:hypothetical protein n=1 Tax=Catellatospora sp. TT07R-123 TaxID=2733863 RepID=UPI001B066EB4|nr:hypothetical protein [Catellatospora sp. TT07R-123]GHJ49382.1 hypothetical protein Cs7R123_67240 [Catellatospora sp. TT07R-123]